MLLLVAQSIEMSAKSSKIKFSSTLRLKYIPIIFFRTATKGSGVLFDGPCLSCREIDVNLDIKI